MKERPILFSGPMVRAMLEGRKTQTRRVVKCSHLDYGGAGGKDSTEWNDPAFWGYECENGEWVMLEATEKGDHQLPCPYGVPGDRIWVRESFATVNPRAGCELNRRPEFDGVRYMATWDKAHHGGWKPSIHMPRWASRITLEVTGVRVERLQEISEEDAIAEGIERSEFGGWKHYPHEGDYCACGDWKMPQNSFMSLWQSLDNYGPDSWAANPWVWVIEFKRLEERQ